MRTRTSVHVFCDDVEFSKKWLCPIFCENDVCTFFELFEICSFEFQKNTKFILGIYINGTYMREKFLLINHYILSCRKKINFWQYIAVIYVYFCQKFVYFISPKIQRISKRKFRRTILMYICRSIIFFRFFGDRKVEFSKKWLRPIFCENDVCTFFELFEICTFEFKKIQNLFWEYI